MAQSGERVDVAALYPGSFDPIHNGHLDVIARAANLFDQVIIGVYDKPDKRLFFSTAERVGLVEASVGAYPNVRVESYAGLTVYFAASRGVRAIVRGLRATSDFDFEFQVALMNRHLSHEVEAIFLMTSMEHAHLSSTLVKVAGDLRVAIALEDLKIPGPSSSSRRLNRRLSSWPRSELHRQIAYKALAAGVPIIKVNPAWTSKTCPACGARRRDRVGQDFVCVVCNWEMDRQHNAGLNILKTALASDEALARAVRFRPGALRRDVVIPLCDLLAREGAREEPSGVESLAGMA